MDVWFNQSLCIWYLINITLKIEKERHLPKGFYWTLLLFFVKTRYCGIKLFVCIGDITFEIIVLKTFFSFLKTQRKIEQLLGKFSHSEKWKRTQYTFMIQFCKIKRNQLYTLVNLYFIIRLANPTHLSMTLCCYCCIVASFVSKNGSFRKKSTFFLYNIGSKGASWEQYLPFS